MTIELIAGILAVVAVVGGFGASAAVKRRKGAGAAGTLQAGVMLAVAVLALVLAVTGNQHRLLHAGLGVALLAIGISVLRRNRHRETTAMPDAARSSTPPVAE